MLRHIRGLLPKEQLLYVADQANVPYGPRQSEEIRQLSEGITRYLLSEGAKLIVVACNTASGAALTHLRLTFPDTIFVGMEPAVKPAAMGTKSGKVGVLATVSTFESQRYVNLMQRFARDVVVLEDPCLGLVEQIESGEVDTPATEQLLRSKLAPMLAQGVDTVVLGCTHYPFVLSIIEQIVGPEATVIDPAPAVARQTVRMLRHQDRLSQNHQVGETLALTTGDLAQFSQLSRRLLGDPLLKTAAAVWEAGRLRSA